MWLPLLFNFNLQKPYRTVPFRPVLIVLIKNKEPCTRFLIGQTKEGVRNTIKESAAAHNQTNYFCFDYSVKSFQTFTVRCYVCSKCLMLPLFSILLRGDACMTIVSLR